MQSYDSNIACEAFLNDISKLKTDTDHILTGKQDKQKTWAYVHYLIFFLLFLLFDVFTVK